MSINRVYKRPNIINTVNINDGVFCVYTIRCIATGNTYTGCSKRVRARKTEHFYQLRNNRHPNRNLQKDFNKYGEHSFVFVIERPAGDFAHARHAEIELINRRKEKRISYNLVR